VAGRRLKQALGVLVGSVACAGCLTDADRDGVFRAACLGDSNTVVVDGVKKWCEIGQTFQPTATVWRNNRLVTEPTELVNLAGGGSTVCKPPINWSWAVSQLIRAQQARADIVLAAFGTNDVRTLGKTPRQIVDCYRTLITYALGTPVFIALTPPDFEPNGPDPGVIEAVNDALRAAFPPNRPIDFYTDFPEDDFDPDGIHLSLDVGQPKRALRALALLRAR